MTAIAIVLLSVAVVLNAGVTAWMLWHYRRGMRASSAWLDRLTAAATANERDVRAKMTMTDTGGAVVWKANHIVTPEERQDDAWVAEIGAQTEDTHGCDIYHMTARLGGVWDDMTIKFSEADADTSCLCTLVSTYKLAGGVDMDAVRSMAYLGAMVALAHGGGIDIAGNWAYLPDDLPPHVREAIDRFLPDDAQNEADAIQGVE